MTYAVKEIFYTLQGEGANAGRPAVFLPLCWLQSVDGLERDRATVICCFAIPTLSAPTARWGGSSRR